MYVYRLLDSSITSSMFSRLRQLVVTTALASSALAAGATVIIDRSPDSTNSPILIENLLNVEGQLTSQWNVERFTSSEDFVLHGISIFSNSYGINKINSGVTIRIWESADNQPSQLLFKEYSYISEQDTDGSLTAPNLTRKFAIVNSPLLLVARVQYWVSMTGTVDNLGMATYTSADDGSTWLGRTGDTLVGECSFCGDMAFQIVGTPTSPVPEPSSYVLLVFGISLLALRRVKLIGQPSTALTLQEQV